MVVHIATRMALLKIHFRHRKEVSRGGPRPDVRENTWRHKGKEKETFRSCHGTCSWVCESSSVMETALGLWNTELASPPTTGILTFSLKGHQSFHVFTSAFNVSGKVSKRMKRGEASERKGGWETGFRHGQRWSRTLRDSRSKRGKDQSDQFSDQGQSYEVYTSSSYLIQIQSSEWLHRKLTRIFDCPYSMSCTTYGFPVVLAKWQCSHWSLFKKCPQISGAKAKSWMFIVYMSIKVTLSEQANNTLHISFTSRLFVMLLMKLQTQTNNFNGKPMNHKTVHLNQHLYVK